MLEHFEDKNAVNVGGGATCCDNCRKYTLIAISISIGFDADLITLISPPMRQSTSKETGEEESVPAKKTDYGTEAEQLLRTVEEVYNAVQYNTIQYNTLFEMICRCSMAVSD